MDIQQMHAILMVAKCGSITKAAGLLYTSVPGLKSQVDAIEAELGCRLFTRSAHGCTPTACGDAFCKGAQDLIDTYGKFTEHVKEAADTHLLRISVLPNKVIHVLDTMYAEYSNLYPDDSTTFVPVTIERMYADIEDNLADLGFFSANDPKTREGTLEYSHIGLFQHFCGVMLPNHDLMAHGLKSLTPEDLEGFDVVSANCRYPENILAHHKIEKIVSMDRYDIMTQCAKGTVCICDHYLAESLTGLCSLPLEGSRTELLVGYRSPMVPPVGRFIECARKALSRQAPHPS